MTHSPGPWKIARRSRRGYYLFIDAGTWTDAVRVVVRMEGNDTDRPEGLANACLAVAAPDLLAALKSVEWAGESHDRDGCWPCCPSCGAPSPEVEMDDQPAGAPRAGSHCDGCVLAASIVKAEGR